MEQTRLQVSTLFLYVVSAIELWCSSKMRGLEVIRLTRLHGNCTVPGQIAQIRHFTSSYSGYITTHRARHVFGGPGCVTFPRQTDRTKCTPLYTRRPDGKIQLYNIQCTRSLTTKNSYDDAFSTARDNPAKFWSEAAQNIDWFEHFKQTLDNTDIVLPKW